MGEIADDIVDGKMCQLCGCFFVDEKNSLYTHGFPVVCWDCWQELSKEEKQDYARASVNTG